MKVIIVGSNGYLGQVLNKKLKSKKYDVTNLDLGIFGKKYAIPGYIKCDAYTYDVSELFSNTDAIVHLAGVSNDPASELNPELTLTMNLNLTKKLIDYAKFFNVNKFIFASSASIYGFNNDFVDERSMPNPQSLYASTKLQSEQYINMVFPNATILRFGTLFGPSEKMRFDIAINLMIKTGLINKKVVVYGGNQFRPFLFVSDAALAIKYALDNDAFGTFNIYSENMDICELGEKISSKLKCDLEIAPATDPRNYKMSTLGLYGYKPRTSLDIGIDQTIKYVKHMIDEEVYVEGDEFYTLRMWKRYINDTLF